MRQARNDTRITFYQRLTSIENVDRAQRNLKYKQHQVQVMLFIFLSYLFSFRSLVRFKLRCVSFVRSKTRLQVDWRCSIAQHTLLFHFNTHNIFDVNRFRVCFVSRVCLYFCLYVSLYRP